MDLLTDERGRMLNTFKTAITNSIDGYPVNRSTLRSFRNLLYLVDKEQKPTQQIVQQIKNSLTNKQTEPEQRLCNLKLARTLSLKQRLFLLEQHENDLINLLTNNNTSNNQQELSLHYEYMSHIHDILFITYQEIGQSEDLHMQAISRVISIYTKIAGLIFSQNREHSRNAFQALRALSDSLGGSQNKMRQRLANILCPRMDEIIDILQSFQARLRSRLYYAITPILQEMSLNQEILERIFMNLQRILDNTSEYEPIIQCANTLFAIHKNVHEIPYYLLCKNLKCIYLSMMNAPFRKEYLPVMVELLKQSQKANNRLKYQISLKMLELSRNFQHQYTRLALMMLCTDNLLQVSKGYPHKKDSVILSIFYQKWFVTRIKDDSDVFKEQFVISLVTSYFQEMTRESPSKDIVKDVLDICHRLLDWICNLRNQGSITTVKLSFDIYLMMLQQACGRLGAEVWPYLSQVLTRIDSQSINFLFKMKVLTLLVKVMSYEDLKSRLTQQFIDGQLKPFMMPKNPKQIFFLPYARTPEGVNESAKEIEYIKHIMNLLTILPQRYPQTAGTIDTLIAQYREYLNHVEGYPSSNTELVMILFDLENEPILNQVTRTYLLALYQKTTELAICTYPLSTEREFIDTGEISMFPFNSPTNLIISPYKFKNGIASIGIKASSHLPCGNVKLRCTTNSDSVELEFEHNVLNIAVEGPGEVHFQAISDSDSILAKGTHLLRIDWKWKKVDWLVLGDPLKLKVCWEDKGFSGKYIGLYWGEPVCIAFEQGSTELLVHVCSKQIIDVLILELQSILDSLTQGVLTLKS